LTYKTGLKKLDGTNTELPEKLIDLC